MVDVERVGVEAPAGGAEGADALGAESGVNGAGDTDGAEESGAYGVPAPSRESGASCGGKDEGEDESSHTSS